MSHAYVRRDARTNVRRERKGETLPSCLFSSPLLLEPSYGYRIVAAKLFFDAPDEGKRIQQRNKIGKKTKNQRANNVGPDPCARIIKKKALNNCYPRS